MLVEQLPSFAEQEHDSRGAEAVAETVAETVVGAVVEAVASTLRTMSKPMRMVAAVSFISCATPL